MTRAARSKTPGLRPVLVIISDGQANVPATEGVPGMEELAGFAAQIQADGTAAVFIDAAPRYGKESDMRQVAERMQAAYVVMEELTAAAILRTFQDFQEQAPA